MTGTQIDIFFGMVKEMHAWVVLNRSVVERAVQQDDAFADRVLSLSIHELPLRMKRLENAVTDENWPIIREQTQLLLDAATELKCHVIPGLCRLVLQECDALKTPMIPVCNLIEFVRILIIELNTFLNQENVVLKMENAI